MSLKELREQNTEQLNGALMVLLKDHFELRMEHKSAQLTDTSKLNKIKKTIAQVKTVIREKQS